MYIRPLGLTITNNSLRYVVISSKSSDSRSLTNIYFYNNRFFFIATLENNSLHLNKFTNDIVHLGDYGILGKLNSSKSMLDVKESFNKLSKLFYL